MKKLATILLLLAALTMVVPVSSQGPGDLSVAGSPTVGPSVDPAAGKGEAVVLSVPAFSPTDLRPVSVIVTYDKSVDPSALADAADGRVVHRYSATCFNPFFELADNLISCWLVRGAMTEDFVLLNGDTLFESAVLERLLASPPRPVTLATDEKPSYDADDMKVQLADGRLLRVGKDLPLDETDGESIGLMVFRGTGPELFRSALERAVRQPTALEQWYLSIVGKIAESGHVWTQNISGLDWSEVDYPLDLLRASAMVGRWYAAQLAEESADLMATG